jgi:hypothetical protein
LLDGIVQIHVGVAARAHVLVEAVEAEPDDPAQLQHAHERQSPGGLHLFLDFPVDCGFPVSSC